jgi:uncharacterized protein (TIGR02246 family)
MQDEEAIKALNDTFVAGLLAKDPKKRASIWAEDGTLVPPNAGYMKGRAAIEQYFGAEMGSITESSKAEFSNYRFDFLTPNLAFVDADLTLKNIMGPDQKLASILAKVVFVAERREGRWWIRNERAHFSS